MRHAHVRGAVFASVLIAVNLVAWRVDAEQNDVTFPPIEELTHYDTVTRGSTVEHLLTTPEALSALKAGEQIPTGTHLVLQDFQSGELYRYLISQKMGDDRAAWQYQWFWPDGSVKNDERTDQCYSCHRSRESSQFMFTHADALSFGG